ncbi:MAG: hypothetical protein COC01_07235 [Bacteroidetes bacterium]|nr:MAG: hypothetical protein COC01_07235 [Bacteroidota bacterium]
MKKKIKFSLLVLVLLCQQTTFAQKGIVQGKLNDQETGEALPFVNVMLIQNDSVICGAITDIEGQYKMEIDSGNYNLKTAYIGYVDALIKKVEIENEKLTIVDIGLEPYLFTITHCFFHCILDEESIEIIIEEEKPLIEEIVINDLNMETKEEVDIPKENNLSIYPNPSTGIINIEMIENVDEVILVDIYGKELEILETNEFVKNTYDLSRYPSGNYFIKYINGNQVMSNQLVLMH